MRSGKSLRGVVVIAVALLGAASVLRAGTQAELVTFQSGQPIRAADFNANFALLQERIDELSRRAAVPGPAGPVGATGPVGPAGAPGSAAPASLVWRAQQTVSCDPTNPWATLGYFNSMAMDGAPPVTPPEVIGRPYTLILTLQPTLWNVGAMTPMAAGDVVCEASWTFYGFGMSSSTVVAERQVTVPVAASSAGFTFTSEGVVPTPTYANGVTETSSVNLRLKLVSSTANLGGASLTGSARLIIAQ